MRSDVQKGGVLEYGWNWTQGVWQGGRVRTLEWRRAEEKPQYVFEPHVSFVLLYQWLFNR